MVIETVRGAPSHAAFSVMAERYGLSSRLLATMVELALKSLAYLKTGRHDHGHDLRDVYLGLDKETKDIVAAVERRTSARSHLPPVTEILKENRDALVSFRYPKLPLKGPSWLALGKAHDVLVRAIDDPAFVSSVPKRPTNRDWLSAYERARISAGSPRGFLIASSPRRGHRADVTLRPPRRLTRLVFRDPDPDQVV